SANPTGPANAATGRHAAYGDSLARILSFAGHEVQREYYVNDYGSQVRRFGESIKARARGEDPPEDGYQGEYVIDLAKRLPAAAGEETYFASDIAYHEDKRERGFDRVIDVWGADHHGHVTRMHVAWEALGGDRDRLELVIMQLVNLMEGGQRAQFSKRRGEFVT